MIQTRRLATFGHAYITGLSLKGEWYQQMVGLILVIYIFADGL